MTNHFIFFHVGDITLPSLLVKTIRKFNPDSKIHFLTDKITNDVNDVDEIFRLNLDRNYLMTARLEAYSKYQLIDPAIYIDSDMLLLRPIFINMFSDKDVYLCKRESNCNNKFNHNFNGLDFSDFEGMTLGQVYPFLACFVYTKNYKFWEDCYSRILNLDEKFKVWYGDQEVLREIYKSREYTFGIINENLISALPEHSDPDKTFFAHFKSKHLKDFMPNCANEILSDHYRY